VGALWAEAQAKVNLGLAVTGRRPDGYHTLDSVLLRLELHDHLEVRPSPDPRGSDRLVVSRHDDLGNPGARLEAATADDLVLRAAAALRRRTGRPLPALSFRLDKHIPVAAGLGGGSTDAATALELAIRAWALEMDDVALADVALEVGADVPFFVARLPSARIGGIGERVLPLRAPSPPAGVLLVTRAERLATAAVFAELDRVGSSRRAADPSIEAVAQALAQGTDGTRLATLAGRLRDANDLWSAASRLQPGLEDLRATLESVLGRPCLLSGSGPTLVALYPSPQEAAAAAAGLRAAPPGSLAGTAIHATASAGGRA
jgi:4-diphosphocytidyl-2-C-methyl-D-erythritol kinase